jgi:hypothetical protein
VECKAEKPKYKCPKCWAAYCSVACCRDHKQNTCQGTTEASSSTKTSRYLPSDLLTRDPIEGAKQQRLQQQIDEDLDEGWKITQEMMNTMDKSDWLREELTDGGLRQLIHQVCTASTNVASTRGKTFQEEELEMLQSKYSNFRVFLDKLKVLTGVLERPDDYHESTEDWLKHAQGYNMGPLALKPLPTRRVVLPPLDDNQQVESDDPQQDDNDSDSTSSSSSDNSIDDSGSSGESTSRVDAEN